MFIFHGDAFPFAFCFPFYLWPHSFCNLVMQKMEYSTWHGLEKWKIAWPSTTWLQPAVWLQQSIERDRERERGEKVCEAVCAHRGLWVRQSRTDNHRGLSNTLHSTLVLIWRTCGTNIKENTGFSWRGNKRTTRTQYIPTGLQFVSLNFCFCIAWGQSVWAVSVWR